MLTIRPTWNKFYLGFSYVNLDTGVYTVKTYHHMEAAYVDHVKVIGSDSGEEVLSNVAIMLRMPVSTMINISLLYKNLTFFFSETLLLETNLPVVTGKKAFVVYFGQ